MSAVAVRVEGETLSPRAIRWARSGGFVSALVGLLVLAGWIFDVDVLRSIVPGLVSMKANTAVVLLALGATLALTADDARVAARRRATRSLLAAFGIAVSLASVSQSWLGVDYGIDELLFRDPTATGAAPGRMAQPTGFALALVGATVLLVHARRSVRLALSVAAAGLGCFAWLNVIGYFYGVTALTRPSSSVPMALHTSATVALLLALSAILLARDGWAAILLAESAPAELARRLVPVALLLPVGLGWLRMSGEELGWFEPQMGVAIFALLNVLILNFLILAFAARLHRLAEARLGAERERERTSARLAAVLDSVGHAVFVIDGDRLVRLFSRTSEKMLGLGAAEALGRDPASFHAAADVEEARRWYAETVDAGAEAGREWRWARADGTAFDVDVRLSPIRSNGGEPSGFVGVASDITLRKETERVMAEARIAAEEASLQKTRFVANMSHELRTPLNAIIGFSYLLRQTGAATFTSDQLRQVTTIESSGRHLLQVINDILDLSKVEMGRMTLNPGPLDTAALVEECRVLASAAAGGKSLTIEASVAPDTAELLADAKMMKQILVNLLGNAVKFTPPGGRVTVSVARRGTDRVEIRVTDTGIGIDPADQARIFDAFHQVDSASSREQEGTGLGLTLTRRLVELHGGTIRAESEGTGRGSTFVVELPVGSDPEFQLPPSVLP